MAFANFFDRAVTGASNVLQDFNPEVFQTILSEKIVGIAFDCYGMRTSEGKVAIELVINLLSRLYPNIAIVPLDSESSDFTNSLQDLSKEINPEISIYNDFENVSHCIVVGKTKINVPVAIHIGSKGWISKLNSNKPVEVGNSNNPFGAAAAACFGTANIFRSIFSEQILNADIDQEINISLLDYQDNGANQEFDNVNFEDWHLVGCGAVGNGAVWALSKIENLKGKLHIIDHEEVELTNLQRYILMKQEHVNCVKVDVANKYLEKQELEVHSCSAKWSNYVKEVPNYKIDNVAVSVDSAEDRIAIQASLPKFIINSWTQIGNLGISRHNFIDSACLACLYLPDNKQQSEDEIIANALKLPSQVTEIRKLLYQNSKLDRNFLSRVATAFNVPVENLFAYEGKYLREFYQSEICGGTILKFDSETESTDALVPMAFQSALAGIMLGAEIVGHALGLKKDNLPTRTTINLLKPLATHREFKDQKHDSKRCICQDEDFQLIFSNKWN